MLRTIDELLHDPAESRSRLLGLVHEFDGIVNNREFPCIYSMQPFSTGDIRFDMLSNADAAELGVVSLLRDLCAIIKNSPDAVGVIFIDRTAEQTMADDMKLASSILHAAMRANALDYPDVDFPKADQPEWMLWLEKTGLFLNFSSPSHKARRSRNVGSAFTVIAQARESFDRLGRSSPRARAEIRRRLALYDAVPPHPSLASYGDPTNREVLQFFLGDSTVPRDITEVCPHG